MATPRLAAMLVILMSLAGVVYGQASQVSGSHTGAFNSAMWVPNLATNCAGLGMRLIESPGKNYSLEHVTKCLNQTPRCWVGVYDKSLGADIFSPTATNVIWSIPPVNFTVNQSCTLQFTSDGDLQLVIFDMRFDEQGITEPTLESGRVNWSSNTTGEGAVQVQLQDTGNLVLVNKDGKSVVWTSSTAPLLPLEPLNDTSSSSSLGVSPSLPPGPLNATSSSSSLGVSMLPALSVVCSSALLLGSIQFQLKFHGIFC